jgi:6-phosphogluconate dehydrogenase
MPGGSEAAYALVKDIFEKIAAQVDGPCCAYIGPRGAGHYVKMVHNGIEYGIMECISEVYDLLKTVLGLKAPALAKIFAAWTAAELGGYLMDITADILTRKDADTKKPLVDVILDKAGQKGTGKWTSQNALDLGVAVPTIDMAVEGRILSAFKEERVAAAKVLKGPRPRAGIAWARLVKALRDGLYVSVIACYAQGFALLREASREYQYDLKLPEVARIWKGGCIIRSKLLDPITEAYRARPDLANLLVAPFFAKIVKAKAHGLRLAVTAAVKAGVPVLGLGSALSYIDAYRRPRMPADLTQAQRDYFGAHTYERLDKPGTFHTEWIERPC